MKINKADCVRIFVSVFLLFLCIRYWSIAEHFAALVLGAAWPLIIGAAIAYIINILMTLYERHYPKFKRFRFLRESKRMLCIIAAIITLVAIISLVIVLVAPQLTSCIKLIISLFPQAMSEFIIWLDSLDIVSDDAISMLSSINWQSKIGQIFGVLTSGISNVMTVLMDTLTKVFSAIVTAFLSIIFAIYLLSGKERISRQVSAVARHFLKEKLYSRISYALGVLNDCFRKYIIGQCTEAVILGGLCTLGMLLLRIPYATMIGALTAFTALIPIAGAYIGAGVGAFMIVTVSPVKAVIFLVFILLLQQIEGNIIYPRVVGSSIGLPGIWVLAAVTVGGGMFGVAGMLLAVPVAAAAYKMLRNYVVVATTEKIAVCENEPSSDEDV
ncbi:MAG: AI-2E family transporter [Clostridia bacterium]|nr:AI-2E family transporter [Clostridia bacterium]